MKINEAEKLICPFMGNMVDAFCITNKCMAWESTIELRRASDDKSKSQFCYPDIEIHEKLGYINDELTWKIKSNTEGRCTRL